MTAVAHDSCNLSMQLPRHIAVIMDGNTRWASRRALQPVEGHKQGVETLRMVIEYCARKGIEYLTAYTFSSENWRRSQGEVDGLMSLFAENLQQESGQLSENNIAIRFIGDRSRINPELVELMHALELDSPDNPRMTLILAFDYGGRQDIVFACRKLAQQVQQGRLQPQDINEETVAACIDLAGVPDPELCIRTSNIIRISNFLLWQCAYTEYHFSSVLWPDFSEQDMDVALADFASRKRRYGTSSVVR